MRGKRVHRVIHGSSRGVPVPGAPDTFSRRRRTRPCWPRASRLPAAASAAASCPAAASAAAPSWRRGAWRPPWEARRRRRKRKDRGRPRRRAAGRPAQPSSERTRRARLHLK